MILSGFLETRNKNAENEFQVCVLVPDERPSMPHFFTAQIEFGKLNI